MKIVEASATVVNPYEEYMTTEQYMHCAVKHLETVGRVCYQSGDLANETSYGKFIRNIIDRGHEAVIEHSGFTVCFIVDRGVSHELVRHRMSSFAQESTRYCNYSKDKYNNEITVVKPFFLEEGTDNYNVWLSTMELTERYYLGLLNNGATPQEARSVLANSLKTEVMMTANFRSWRNFFKLRIPKSAHPQIREVTIPLLRYLKEVCPIIFDDIVVSENV